MKPSPPVQVTRRGMMAAGLVIGVGFALVLVAGVFLALKLSDLVQDNRQAIVRIHRIEKPSDADILAGTVRALRAIRSCARSPACRKRNPGVASVARSIPRGELPRARRAARRRRSSSPTSGGGGATSGGNGTTTARPPSPRPQAPSQTGSRPQPTVRPPAGSPAPANPPASPPQAAPKPLPAPAPTPAPPRPPPVVSVPPVTTPPITVPPVTVPPVTLPGVCVPLPGVVCPKVR